MPQSVAPAMNIDGTSMQRPESPISSAMSSGLVPHRYHWSAAWNPVLPNASAYTASSSSVSHAAALPGISGATVSAMFFSSAMT